MSKPIEQLGAELTIKVAEIATICKSYGFDAVPSLLLRHVDGSQSSLMISNDVPENLIRCIRDLASEGIESDLTAHAAAARLLLGRRP